MATRGALTNTVPIDAYRGAGKPEANYIIERLIDAAAPVVGIDATELRRRNLVSAFPHRTAMATTIDGGRFAGNIAPALAAAAHDGFAARRAESAARGRLRGIGVTCFLETSRGANDEGAELRFHADGTVSLHSGNQSIGQGHETSFRQIAADHLGLPMAALRFVQADTFLVRDGNGHGGARSMHQGGTALVRAMEAALEKGRPIAARLLNAAPEDVSYANGAYRAGDRAVALADVANAERTAEGSPLDTWLWNKNDIITFPNGVHVAEVEIDPETGFTTLERYTSVDDFGAIINPLLTAGQMHGGLAQGVGQAMFEHTVYDQESGQLLSGSFMDYAVPRAADLPDFAVTLSGVPTTGNPLGVKGVGQSGAIAAPPAVMSAILNALAPRGVRHLDMPATPERIWRALRAAG
jgi:carbon-monoxide dehydrogenase large subunit